MASVLERRHGSSTCSFGVSRTGGRLLLTGPPGAGGPVKGERRAETRFRARQDTTAWDSAYGRRLARARPRLMGRRQGRRLSSPSAYDGRLVLESFSPGTQHDRLASKRTMLAATLGSCTCSIKTGIRHPPRTGIAPAGTALVGRRAWDWLHEQPRSCWAGAVRDMNGDEPYLGPTCNPRTGQWKTGGSPDAGTESSTYTPWPKHGGCVPTTPVGHSSTAALSRVSGPARWTATGRRRRCARQRSPWDALEMWQREAEHKNDHGRLPAPRIYGPGRRAPRASPLARTDAGSRQWVPNPAA